jgi:hypothetical protein
MEQKWAGGPSQARQNMIWGVSNHILGQVGFSQGCFHTKVVFSQKCFLAKARRRKGGFTAKVVFTQRREGAKVFLASLRLCANQE